MYFLCWQIICSDVQSHESGVGSVAAVASDVIASEGGAQATNMRSKVDDMNRKWDIINGKLRDKQIVLDDALKEVSFVGASIFRHINTRRKFQLIKNFLSHIWYD